MKNNNESSAGSPVPLRFREPSQQACFYNAIGIFLLATNHNLKLCIILLGNFVTASESRIKFISVFRTLTIRGKITPRDFLEEIETLVDIWYI